MKILNLGAGNRIVPNADNHDIVKHRGEINLVFDLNGKNWLGNVAYNLTIPLSDYPNGIYDEIQFISVIEHLMLTPIESLNECWHLLKPTGKLIVKYPHHTSYTAYSDPTHRWFLNEYSLDYVDPDTYNGKNYSYYTPYKWHILTPVENRMIVKPGNRINVKMELTPIK